ncbi:MAG: CPBP family intramembrane metalloprotease [Clostridiales bacterium]|nr:CPBP family intramembrane metalloprotease [Clostridiales bacterium]
MDARKQISRVGWCFVAFILVYMAASWFLSLVIFFAFFRFDMRWYDNNLSMLLADLLMYGVAFPVFFLLMRRLPSWRKEKKEAVSVSGFVRLFFISLGTTYLGNLIGLGLMAAVGESVGQDILNPVTETFGNMEPWAMFVTTVLIAPVMEELMFRKMLIDRLVPFGQKMAVLLSGLCFGLFHGNFYQFFYATALGFIFAYVYSSTGRLREPVLLHMCINFVGGVLPTIVENGIRAGNLSAWWADAGLTGILLFSIAVAVMEFVKRIRLLSWFPAWERSEKGMVFTVLTAPGVWGFLIASVMLFFMN